MAVKWKLRDGKWRRINVDTAPKGVGLTILLSATLRAILDDDYHETKNPTGLTPEEQREAIKEVPGMTAKEMEAIIPTTGPALSATIRSVISAHRAQNRTDKDKQKPR